MKPTCRKSFSACSKVAFVARSDLKANHAAVRLRQRPPLTSIPERYTSTAVSDKKLTTIRLDEEDREILARLCSVTGLDSGAAAIRLAIRESLAAREPVSRARGKR